MIHVLLDACVDINKPDVRSGRSLLHVASANGLAIKLLDLGADALRKDQQGRTAVNLAASEEVKSAFAEHCHQVACRHK